MTDRHPSNRGGLSPFQESETVCPFLHVSAFWGSWARESGACWLAPRPGKEKGDQTLVGRVRYLRLNSRLWKISSIPIFGLRFLRMASSWLEPWRIQSPFFKS